MLKMYAVPLLHNGWGFNEKDDYETSGGVLTEHLEMNWSLQL